MKKFLPMFLLAAMLLSACGGAAEPTAPPPAPEAVAAASPTPAPAPTEPLAAAVAEAEMAEPTTEPAAEPTNWLTSEGKLADGRTFLGNPDAPVTMVDYSDFL